MSNLTNTRRIQPTWHTPPTLDNHLANKAYVDSKTKTLDVKDPCVAATTSKSSDAVAPSSVVAPLEYTPSNSFVFYLR